MALAFLVVKRQLMGAAVELRSRTQALTACSSLSSSWLRPAAGNVARPAGQLPRIPGKLQHLTVFDPISYAITYAGVPAAPGLTARAVDANQIKLTWNKPNSYGSEINSYWLYVYENGEKLYDWDNILDIVTLHGDETEYTVGVNPETTRYFRIRAHNDNGTGKYSALRQATTPAD